MAQTEIRIRLPGPAGTWDSDTIFKRNDIVTYGIASYISRTDVNQNNNPRDDSDTWQLIAMGRTGIQGPPGVGIDSEFVLDNVAGLDSEHVIRLIDSDYVNARVVPSGVVTSVDSEIVFNIIDSDYIQDKVESIDFTSITSVDFIGDLNGAIRFVAQASENILKGQAVYVSGASGDTPRVMLANASNPATMPAMGLARADIAQDSEGEIVTFGNLTGVDTDTYEINQVLYVSDSENGGLMSSPPRARDSLIQNIGRVVRSQQNNGIIKVGGAGRTNAVDNATRLDLIEALGRPDSDWVRRVSNQSLDSEITVLANHDSDVLASLINRNVVHHLEDLDNVIVPPGEAFINFTIADSDIYLWQGTYYSAQYDSLQRNLFISINDNPQDYNVDVGEDIYLGTNRFRVESASIPTAGGIVRLRLHVPDQSHNYLRGRPGAYSGLEQGGVFFFSRSGLGYSSFNQVFRESRLYLQRDSADSDWRAVEYLTLATDPSDDDALASQRYVKDRISDLALDSDKARVLFYSKTQTDNRYVNEGDLEDSVNPFIDSEVRNIVDSDYVNARVTASSGANTLVKSLSDIPSNPSNGQVIIFMNNVFGDSEFVDIPVDLEALEPGAVNYTDRVGIPAQLRNDFRTVLSNIDNLTRNIEGGAAGTTATGPFFRFSAYPNDTFVMNFHNNNGAFTVRQDYAQGADQNFNDFFSTTLDSDLVAAGTLQVSTQIQVPAFTQMVWDNNTWITTIAQRSADSDFGLGDSETFA